MMNVPSLKAAVVRGGIGFCVVSLLVFATVAFAERWMYTNLTVLGAYLVWTILFIALGGGVLGSLVDGRWRLPKFYLLFGLAFLVYAAGWVFAYFTLRGYAGEWVGSLAGSILMALVFAAGFQASERVATEGHPYKTPRRSFVGAALRGRPSAISSTFKFSIILFAANSIGYFLGSALNDAFGGPVGMLLWGTAYGLFLGAGLGAVLHFAQTKS